MPRRGILGPVRGRRTGSLGECVDYEAVGERREGKSERRRHQRNTRNDLTPDPLSNGRIFTPRRAGTRGLGRPQDKDYSLLGRSPAAGHGAGDQESSRSHPVARGPTEADFLRTDPAIRATEGVRARRSCPPRAG